MYMQVFRSVHVNILQPNERITFDLYVKRDHKLIPFIAKDEVLTQDQLLEAHRGGISRLYVQGKDRELLEKYVNSFLERILTNPAIPTVEKARAFYLSSSYAMQKAFEYPNAESIEEIKNSVKPILKNIMKDDLILNELISTIEHDHCTYTHSINVGIIATALTIKFYDRDLQVGIGEMERLSYGYFLHDIGKSRITPAILKKAGPLTDEEWKVMKKHPEWGYSILMETGHLTDEATYISLQHHERPNGSGYPKGVKIHDIHPCARICAIADTFDALISERPYKTALMPFEALTIMKQEAYCEVDTHLLATLINLLGPQHC
jgi:HD-GYP domain-containing protein (c-di-GMP phosphodiesterase class II)